MSEFSPFRYPGGKNWFVPQIRAWLAALPQRPAVFVEPFAGGASIGLAVASECLTAEVVLMEKSREIAAVWHALLGGNAPWLAEQALAFQPTEEHIRHLLEQPVADTVTLALQTLLRNRFSRSREIHPDASLKLRRDKQTGELFWHPQTLAKRLLAIHAIRERIRFIEGDALVLLPDYLCRTDCAVFLDPPYSVGTMPSHRHYYPQMEVDFGLIFEMLSGAEAAWLMICDDLAEIRALVQQHSLTVIEVPRRHGHRVHEIIVGSSFPSLLKATELLSKH